MIEIPALRSSAIASVVVLAAALVLTLLIPEVQGSWVESLTITGKFETGQLSSPSSLTCDEEAKGTALTWQAADQADGYIVYHRGPRSDDYHRVGDIDAPATTYRPLQSSYFRHDWQVTSSLSSWESDPSESITVLCRPNMSSSGPKQLEAENYHSQRTVELTWVATPGAVVYGIVRTDEANGSYELLGTTTDNSYTDTSVADGITYYYLVVAVDEDGNESDPSEIVAVADTASPDGLAPSPGDADDPGATPTPTASSVCDSDCPAVVKLGNMTVMTGGTGMGTVQLDVLNVQEPGLGTWSIEVLYNRDFVVSEGCVAHDGTCNPDYAAGTIQIVGTSGGKVGDSTLVNLSFSCLAAGASGLAIDVRVLLDASAGGGQPIVADIQNGGVTCVVPAGGTPEPTVTEALTPTPTPEPTATPTPAVEAPAPTVDAPLPTPTASAPPAHEASMLSWNGPWQLHRRA